MSYARPRATLTTFGSVGRNGAVMTASPHQDRDVLAAHDFVDYIIVRFITRLHDDIGL